MESREVLGARPLYRQVRDVLVRRIADGTWTAGQVLPSEPDLATDLGVSQGTVRKALDEMTAENLVVRRQGRGTYVARHDDARIMFQFFKLVPDGSEPQFPESRILKLSVCKAGADAAKRLAMPAGADTVQIERVRSLAGRACILERIVLPRELFPGIEAHDLPNNLYELYGAAFGVPIGRAGERLKAVAATEEQAKPLDIVAGTPLLSVDRIAYSIDGRPVEWRMSLCRTDAAHYLSDLR